MLKKKEKVNTCSTCESPSHLGMSYEWTNEGIFLKKTNKIPFLVIPHNLYSSICKEISSSCESDIGPLITEARRRIVRSRVLNSMNKKYGAASKSGSISIKLLQSVLSDFYLSGGGKCKIEEFKRSRELSVNAVNPYNPEMAAGDIQGLFEGLFGVDAEMEYSVDSREGNPSMTVELRKIASNKWNDGSGDQPQAKIRKLKPKDILFEKCEQCGIPKGVSFNIRNGCLYAKCLSDSDEPVIVTSPEDLKSTFRYVIAHTGKGSYEAIKTGGKSFALSVKKENPFSELQTLKFAGVRMSELGWGYFNEIISRPFVYELNISNCFYNLIVEGMIEGILESISGIAFDSEIIPRRRDLTIIKVGPDVEAIYGS